MFYIYDKITKEFLRETEGQINPLKDGKFLTPPFSTTIKPIASKTGFLVCFNIDKWEYIADNRDKNYWLKSDASKVEFALGNVVDNTMTDKEPLNDFPLWSIDKWIDEPVATAQQAKDKRKAEIDTRLDEIDRLTIRSLRSINRGRGNTSDDSIMTALDDEAITLRTERGAL